MDVFRALTRRLIGCCLAAAVALGATAAEDESIKSEVKVDGFGLFGNAELRRSLDLLEIGEGPIPRQKIDDGAFLLLSRLKQSGFLNARLEGNVTTVDGEEMQLSWTTDFVPQLEEKVQAKRVVFEVEEGQLYYLESISFSGLDEMSPDEARDYFIPDNALLTTKKAKSYSPSILSNAKRNFIGALVAQGFADAQVVSEEVNIDEETGAVDVSLAIEEGPRYHVTESRVQIYEGGELVNQYTDPEDATYTRFWVEDKTRSLRNESYHLGFPDTRVTSRVVESELVEDGERKNVAIQFEVRRGSRQIISEVVHRGATDTKQSLLERRADLEPGEPLDITEVEQARRELSRTGIFDRVDLSYEQISPGQRRVIFTYENAERVQGQLLVGYGSYEQFRAGFIGRRYNVLGRAHTLGFEAIQSFKSTRGELSYQVPELLGERIDGNFQLEYLDRQEPSFDRKERGVTAGLSTYLRDLGINVGLDYTFELVEAENVPEGTDLLVEPTNIGSLALRATRSTVDNVLYPTDGYEISSAVRYAAELLGGETEFTRLESGISYHEMLDERWIFHLGARGGFAISPGDNRSNIPLNERFLIGGENTLRGFQRGEAGPVEDGDYIGAEAFILFNAEAEYPILEKLNAVAFVDAARVWDNSGRLGQYDDFISVGLGLRYQTFVGPVRIEYGHNLDPRPEDPDGTLHISIGFPF